MKAYTKTAVKGDSVDLAITTIDELIAAYASLKASHAALVAKHNTLAAKLNADAGVTDTNYATDAADTSKAAPATAASQQRD